MWILGEMEQVRFALHACHTLALSNPFTLLFSSSIRILPGALPRHYRSITAALPLHYSGHNVTALSSLLTVQHTTQLS